AVDDDLVGGRRCLTGHQGERVQRREGAPATADGWCAARGVADGGSVLGDQSGVAQDAALGDFDPRDLLDGDDQGSVNAWALLAEGLGAVEEGLAAYDRVGPLVRGCKEVVE